MKKEKKAVASIETGGAVIMGYSDVIRWNDNMAVNGHLICIKKAVKLGLEYKLPIAEKLQKDLKSTTGLLITFPIGMLMSDLQEKVGSGAELLELVKPEENV
jgi:hypothetical protein